MHIPFTRDILDKETADMNTRRADPIAAMREDTIISHAHELAWIISADPGTAALLAIRHVIREEPVNRESVPIRRDRRNVRLFVNEINARLAAE